MWAVPSILIFWISLVLMLPGILLVTLFSPFLISPRAQTTTGIVSVFISNILLTSISKSLYSDNSLYEFCWGVTSRRNCYVNEHAPSFSLVFGPQVMSVGFYLPGPNRYFARGDILMSSSSIYILKYLQLKYAVSKLQKKSRKRGTAWNRWQWWLLNCSRPQVRNG